MWLRTLRLENFRNYEALELEFGDGLNLLHGPNGSGKTGILEAVSYLAVARSLRGAADADVVRWGESGFGVGGEVDEGGSSRTIVLRFARGRGKEVRIDGEPVARLADLVGRLRVAWFSPEDTWITKGGPEARRRLIDMTLCQIDRSYLSALANYRRALRQRNEALLAWAPDEESERVVEIWTERLLEYGSKVIARRIALVPRFAAAVSEFHAAIVGRRGIELVYKTTIGINAEELADEADAAEREGVVRERYAEALRQARADERRRGFTLIGPHRDDLEVRVAGRALRSYGSQGQHRTAAIALKLGEAAMLDAEGRGAVVLLDDVLSELDAARASALVDHIGTVGQALVTSTSRDPAGALAGRDAMVFLVDGGRVVRE